MDTPKSPRGQSAVAIFSSWEGPLVLLRSVQAALVAVKPLESGVLDVAVNGISPRRMPVRNYFPVAISSQMRRSKFDSGTSLLETGRTHGTRSVARFASRYSSIARPGKCPPATLVRDWTKGNARQCAELVRRHPFVAFAVRKLPGRRDWTQAEQPAVLLWNSSCPSNCN